MAVTPEHWKRISAVFAEAVVLSPGRSGRVPRSGVRGRSRRTTTRSISYWLPLPPRWRRGTPSRARGSGSRSASRMTNPARAKMGRPADWCVTTSRRNWAGAGWEVVYLAKDTRLGSRRRHPRPCRPPVAAAGPYTRRAATPEDRGVERRHPCRIPGIAAVYSARGGSATNIFIRQRIYVDRQSLRPSGRIADGPMRLASRRGRRAREWPTPLLPRIVEGIVHRDLKPDNVLLSEDGGS